MDIEIRDEKKKDYILQVGDIIQIMDSDNPRIEFCVVIKDRKKNYKLRRLMDNEEVTGDFDNLESLTTVLKNLDNYKIFPQSEYKLVLERK